MHVINRGYLECFFFGRYWFDHDEPWPIKLSGQELQNAFSEGGQVQTEVFDAIIRLLQVEDTIMYSEAGCEHQQWRHLLPPCFGVSAMNHYINISLRLSWCC